MTSVLTVKHPTTWVFLDDEPRFLDALKRLLPVDQPVILFDDPNKALTYFENLRDPKSYNWELGNSLQDLDATDDFICSPARFEQPSVLIVDYAMPGTDGLAVCREIESLRVKTILLTGVADEATATAAFNEGIIDRFVKKEDVEALSKIVEFATDLADEVLREAYPMVSTEESRSSLLELVYGTEEFQSFLTDNQIVEYYALSEPLGMLGLNRFGAAFLFLIENTRGQNQLDSAAGDEPLIFDHELSARELTRLGVDEEAKLARSVRFVVEKAPPLSVDYDPAVHSLEAFLRESQV